MPCLHRTCHNDADTNYILCAVVSAAIYNCRSAPTHYYIGKDQHSSDLLGTARNHKESVRIIAFCVRLQFLLLCSLYFAPEPPFTFIRLKSQCRNAAASPSFAQFAKLERFVVTSNFPAPRVCGTRPNCFANTRVLINLRAHHRLPLLLHLLLLALLLLGSIYVCQHFGPLCCSE